MRTAKPRSWATRAVVRPMTPAPATATTAPGRAGAPASAGSRRPPVPPPPPPPPPAATAASWQPEPVGDGDEGQQLHVRLDGAVGPVVDDQPVPRRRAPVREDAHVIGAGLPGES